MDAIKKIRTAAASAFAGVSCAVFEVQTALASNPPTDAADVINNAGSNATVERVGKTFSGIIGSVYTGLSAIGIIIAVIALIVALVRIAINKNASKRDAAKDQIIWICVALIIIGGAVALVSAAIGVGKNMTV